MPPMKLKVKCGKEFEIEAAGDTSDLIKVIALVVGAGSMLVLGLAAYGAVEGNFAAFEKILDATVKVVEILAHGG